MYKLILFDLDGTLIDTLPEISDAVNDFLREEGLPALAPELVRPGIGLGWHHLLRHVLTASAQAAGVVDGGLSDHRQALFAQHYERHSGANSALYPGVREALHELRARGAKLAIVTNKDKRFTFPALDAHGLRDCFDLILCGNSLPARKPDPLPLRHCMAHFDIAPEHTLFVGDSEIDVAAARNAGVAIWAVSYGYNGHQPIETAQPDRIISSFSALVEAAQAAASKVPNSRTA